MIIIIMIITVVDVAIIKIIMSIMGSNNNYKCTQYRLNITYVYIKTHVVSVMTVCEKAQPNLDLFKHIYVYIHGAINLFLRSV